MVSWRSRPGGSAIAPRRLCVTPDERAELEWRVWLLPAGDPAARRASIVLLAAAGAPSGGIAATVGMDERRARRWRDAFVAHRLAGLEDPPPRARHAARPVRPVRPVRPGRRHRQPRAAVLAMVSALAVARVMVPAAQPGAFEDAPTVASPGRAPPPGQLRAVRASAQSGRPILDGGVVEEVAATESTGPVVALTFDDGPHPLWTPAVLGVLADAGVVATFCIVGAAAREHPDLVRAVRDAGHALCNHTERHLVSLPQLSRGEIEAEMAGASAAIESATGVAPTLYRSPGGALSPVVMEVARQAGMAVLGWSTDSRDWTRTPADTIRQRVLSSVRPGAVVLLHDGGGDRSETVRQLRRLIADLQADGYRFVVPA